MEKEKRIKILNLIDTYYPVVGGVNTVVDKSSIALSKFADVTVGTIKAKNYTDPERPYKIIRCKGFNNLITTDGIAYPQFDKHFRDTIEKGNFDIIHCHSPINLMNYAFKIGKKLKIPVVATIHSIFKPEVKDFLKSETLSNAVTSHLIRIINKADYIFAVSQFCADFVKPFGITKPITIMNNAIDFVAPENTEYLKNIINEKYSLDKSVFTMLFVSRMIKVKNFDLVIDAINLLKEKNYKLKVFLVGDGDYFKTVSKKIKKLRLENYIIMTGMIKDRNLLQAYYARADLVLFPSYMDSAGLVQVEAAAYKKPTLVLEKMAPSEKMTDLYNGILSKNNPEDYAKKIEYCYNNRESLKEIGENAFKTIYRTYDDEKVVKEILNEYNKIIRDYKEKSEKKYPAK
ncbi:MAG: glycosyltransferase family 1 protein [Clostridia bacterium]|nr:glycosyltransferase family 1 protein [Clostridia bacterium]